MDQKRHLPQIKLFAFNGNSKTLLTIQEDVNEYVINCYNKTGNIPEIKHSGDYISVTCSILVTTNYSIPQRIFIPKIK